ncbi:MAG TPA: hypothetical protein ENK18_17550 [Deltaproteobacteria bacterium]|nr:hypothetical protein [Deltaproteobacteria bacterium]
MSSTPIRLLTVALLSSCLACGGALADPISYLPRLGDRVQDVPSNVLLIVVDDVGVDKVGVYGEHPSPPPTPSIDRLAARGVLFRNAYSYPACSPTRASFLTGRHARRTGIGQIIDSWKEEVELSPSEITIPEMLRRSHASWSTSLVGKWHLSSMEGRAAPEGPGEHGFDWYAGTLGNLRDKWPEDREPEWGYTVWNKNTNGEVRLQRGYVTSDTVDDALARIEAMPEPWFLLLSLNAAHLPLHVPPKALRHTRRRLSMNSSEVDLYDATVEAMDTELGRLLDTIDGAILDRTTIVFFGDNGTPDFGIRAPWDPQRCKGTLFEGGVNVPLIVAGPQVQHPGSETAALVHTVDIFATVAEIAGVELDSLGRVIDGVSFLPHVVDPKRPSTREVLYTSRFKPNGAPPHRSEASMVRNATHKLLFDPRAARGRRRSGRAPVERLFALDGGSGLEGPDLLQDKHPSAETQRILEELRAAHARIEADLQR